MSNARTYLESQIRTASPQRLRKMLIDGALKYASQVKLFREQDDNNGAFTATERLRLILDELLNGIKGDSDVADQSKSIYLFLLQTLTNSRCGKLTEEIDTIIEVLRIEQETWDLVCQKHPETLEAAKSNKPTELISSGKPANPSLPQMHMSPAPESSVNIEC